MKTINIKLAKANATLMTVPFFVELARQAHSDAIRECAKGNLRSRNFYVALRDKYMLGARMRKTMIAK